MRPRGPCCRSNGTTAHAAPRARDRCQDERQSRLCGAGRPAWPSRTPAAAVDLPCSIGPLDGMEDDLTGSDDRAVTISAGLPPARIRNAGHACAASATASMQLPMATWRNPMPIERANVSAGSRTSARKTTIVPGARHAAPADRPACARIPIGRTRPVSLFCRLRRASSKIMLCVAGCRVAGAESPGLPVRVSRVSGGGPGRSGRADHDGGALGSGMVRTSRTSRARSLTGFSTVI